MKMDMGNSDTPITTKYSQAINCKPKLVNVLYPGFVKNVDKALEKLGGIRNIEAATCGQKKHLELSFRPSNLHSKPVYSDKDNKPCVLMKIKTKQGILKGRIVSKEIVDYDVVGITAMNLKFNKLCDFQFLPLVSNEEKEYETELEYIYDKLVPNDIPDLEWTESGECDPVPLFILPYQFSKWNTHGNQLYFERSKFYEGRFMQQYCDKFKVQQLQQKMYRGGDKEKIAKMAMLCRFDEEVPHEPTANAVSTLKAKAISEETINKVRNLFKERPIWSRNALMYYSKASNEHMKFILPTLAFHYVSGPWRVMWVRFGYDPKLDPASRMLQTFDYRVRSKGGYKIKIKTKRYSTHSSHAGEQKFSLSNQSTEKTKPFMIAENQFMLREGSLPAARQTFFQFCDVKLSAIEKLLAKLPDVQPGATCNVKHGWLPNGFSDHCREIVNRYIREAITKDIQKLKGNDAEKENSDVSDSSLSSSESDESAGEPEAELVDNGIEDIIDLETVEEINQMLGNAALPEPKAGPSSARD